MLRAFRQRWRLWAALGVAATLAGCAGAYFVQRDPWRKEAEIACLKSGTVRESGTIVRIEPINGPGMCGADFPMKVAALGDNPALAFSGTLRPPGEVPQSGRRSWPPGSQPRSQAPVASERTFVNPLRPSPVQRQPLDIPPQTNAAAFPMPITPPVASAQPVYPSSADASGSFLRAPAAGARRGSVYDAPPPIDDEVDFETEAPRSVRGPAQRITSGPPLRGMPQQSLPVRQPAAPVPLGQGNAIAAMGPVAIKPAATLACPMVSALDRWILDSVQPAAQRWFRQPVTEIRQISAYSCRGMNAQPGARISEHAFGNALDISAFVLADGRRITVKDGWRASPEEQGFLRDVQGAACEQFNTVLAPGSNRFHYDHFHFDLMRRASGNRICNPNAVDGEVIASRVARERGYALRPDSSGVTGSIGRSRAALKTQPRAAKAKARVRNILADDDDDWIEDEGPRPSH
jgi:hypothetical protein